MKKKERKLLKLMSAFFYDTEEEPETINLRESIVAVGIPGLLSGYHGSFSQTKGFKPIKEIADLEGKRYTIIDFTLHVNEYDEQLSDPTGMMLNLKQMTKKQISPIYTEISLCNPLLVEKIKAHSGINKALIDSPRLLSDLLPALGRYKDAVFMHTIKPNASPTLAIVSISQDQIPDLVVSASCRFNKNCKVVW
ncbi:Uncharacterised protein [Salmonella enterica subsp. salamae]|uniref:Uncharacterized protein n=1 Tax=Salmonella enterica TaxID=28901 RepID=A0A379SD77_SALER|nr:hypothetical protein [Salmonella enterica subsp. salamae]EDV1419336.1 hypothetical protein [Salmonella enterica subsp. salamae]SUG27542.1 Uncharacterised protein [Salmonella enterica]SUJ13692.1 Uncharacterised protein [Salmonella enterica subsp. salamae]